MHRIGAATLGSALLSPALARADSPSTQTRARVRGSASDRMEGHFPNVELVTHRSEKVRFYDDLVRGKTCVFNVMYTKCDGICPAAVATLREVQDILGDHAGRDVFIYSLTLEPEIDTPEVLSQYAEVMGAGKGWTFLTGTIEHIDQIRRKLGLYDPDPVIDADKTQHGGLLVYGNENTGQWAAIPGFYDAKTIVKALSRVVPRTGRGTAHG